MPDRRQSDRRQSSGSSKKQLTISLSSFVYICIIFALVICFIFIGSYIGSLNYQKGYDDGYFNGYTDCYNSYEYYYLDESSNGFPYDNEENL